jgi:hypothetical protein
VEERCKGYNGDVGVDLIKKLFTICPSIDYIIWLCPVSVKHTDYTYRLFEEIEMINSEEEKDEKHPFRNATVLVLRRELYVFNLFVREARVEDNDDLLPILKRTNPSILEGQEKYFLANLINSRDENNKLYVGMNKNKLVGMLATSTDVNVSLIKKVFDIDVFGDIILQREPKPKPKMKVVLIVGNIFYTEEGASTDLSSQIDIDGRFVYIDARSSEVLLLEDIDNFEDIDIAIKTLTRLEQLVEEASIDYKETNDNISPLACVIVGYPRTDAEVGAILNRVDFFDKVIEVNHLLSDITPLQSLGAHDDPITANHVDAADTLRMLVQSDDESADAFRSHIQWMQLPNEGHLLTLIDKALNDVLANIDAEWERYYDEMAEDQVYVYIYVWICIHINIHIFIFVYEYVYIHTYILHI